MISMRGLNKNSPSIFTQDYGGTLSYTMLWDGHKSYTLDNYSRHSDAIRGAKRLSVRLSLPYVGKIKTGFEDE